ncbi:MAG: hypothetical protein HN759_01535 [Akkermansiaceae bacterium]|jgi:hypothetical protein|nr:hypothetical protein [Akkermansiaceae bacterium]
MKAILRRSFFPVSFSLSLVVLVSAAPPKKPSVAHFMGLISSSPFTIKPPPPERVKVETPLERDWMLGSIRPIEGGYSVTLINKKNRKERIRFIPGFSAGEFQLLDVEQDTNNSSNSRVRVRKGSQEGWLSYDEKLIKVRPTSTKRVPSRKTGTASRVSPPIPGSRSSSTRSGRQRIVPKKNK